MENPLRDISPIVHTLTQGSPEHQQQALETYFTTDAAFYHPFCRVDSSENSRNQILSIFQWYKILSPDIKLSIQSVAYDDVKLILYVTIQQVFAIWFLFGLHSSDVVLTTKLELEKKEDNKYYIKSQNDLYQTDQFIKFVTVPRGIGAYVVVLWQTAATMVCVIMAHLFAPFTWFMQTRIDMKNDAQQKQEPTNKRLPDVKPKAKAEPPTDLTNKIERKAAEVRNNVNENGGEKKETKHTKT